MRHVRAVGRILACTMAVACLSAGATSAETKILFNLGVSPQHVLRADVFPKWRDAVAKATEGRVSIDFPAADLGPTPQNWDLVTQGVADGGYTLVNFSPSKLLQLPNLPWISATAKKQSIALWRTYRKYFAAAKELKGVEVLAVFTGPPAELFGTSGRVTNLADLKGKKIWALPGSPARALSLMGAAVVTGPATGIYEIVAAGTVDGIVGLSFFDLGAFNVDRFVKHHADYPSKLYSTSFVVFLSNRTWSKISAKDKQAIHSVSGEKFGELLAAWDKGNDRAASKLRTAGMSTEKPSSDTVDRAKELLQPIRKKWLDDAKALKVDGAAALKFYENELARLRR